MIVAQAESGDSPLVYPNLGGQQVAHTQSIVLGERKNRIESSKARS
jgi:hypothetical protein